MTLINIAKLIRKKNKGSQGGLKPPSYEDITKNNNEYEINVDYKITSNFAYKTHKKYNF